MPAPRRPSAQSSLAFHPHRIVISLGVLFVLGSMSLPYVRGDGAVRSSLDADALPVLLLLIPVFALALLPDHSRPMGRGAAVASAMFVLVAVPSAAVTLLDAYVLAGSLGAGVGVGPWLLCAGTVVVAIGVGIGLLRPDAAPARRARAAVSVSNGTAAAITHREPPPLEENPFGEPLFDSLEVTMPPPPEPPRSADAPPAIITSPPQPKPTDTPPDDDPSPSLVIEGERAAGRTVEERDRLEGP